jgi:type II secretory pathway pseudopilin PulG
MNRALTMLELLLVIAIAGLALVGLLVTYVSSLNLGEYDRNLTLAMNIAREKMEELYNERITNFDDLGSEMCLEEPTGCNIEVVDPSLTIVSFDSEHMAAKNYGLDGSCTIYIRELDPSNLKEVRVIVCWKQRVGRIIGEDINLNGVLDPGEDVGGHPNELDSPCEIISAFAKR